MAVPPEPNVGLQRKIIHVDMDAFFASVEQRDNPDLAGKPVAVGFASPRGVVAAASYEARRYGVKSAMPSVTALRLCADLVFVPPRFDVYQSVSRQIRAIFHRHSDLVEPLSLDEAYIDVTIDKLGIGNATRIAEMIRAQIKAETGLTASAGISYNKFLAKIASDQNKPDGQYVIRPHQGADFVAALSVRRFFGVGPKTAERMAAMGIATGGDLRGKSLAFLESQFGKSAGYLFRAARGIDLREVRADRIRKSVGGERTYTSDLTEEEAIYDAFERIIQIVWDRIERAGARGRTVTLKARYNDFQTVSRSRSLPHWVDGKAEFAAISRSLLDQILPLERGIRLLGLTLSSLEGTEEEAAPAMAMTKHKDQAELEF
jgi:DNA polymerase-4